MQHADLPFEIDVKSVNTLLDDGEQFVLIDCREQDEYEFVRLDGAKHIPMGEISGRLDELKAHRDERIVVYCHLGGRSSMVTQFLRQQGFSKAQNMSGGIDSWAVEIDSRLPRYQ